MNSLTARGVVVALLLTLGVLCWRAGRIESRMAAADRALITLRYAMPIDAYDEIEGSLGAADRVMQAALRRSTDLERHRATAQYWLAEFGTLLPERDIDGKPIRDDPPRLFVSANAAYRATILTSPDAAQRLDDVLVAYADVLRAAPTFVDAAYNYEVVARLRGSVSAGTLPPTLRLDAVRAGRDAGAADGQLPDGPTLHGWPGAPPLDQSLQQFKVYVPLRPTEREESDEAGKGPAKRRQG